MNWSRNLKNSLLTRQFDMLAFLDYFYGLDSTISVNFVNLKGIELNLFNDSSSGESSSKTWKFSNSSLQRIFLINSNLRFMINGKKVKTCDTWTNTTASLFQTQMVYNVYFLSGCRFSQTLCPLVFLNSFIDILVIFDLAHTYYKTNLIRFHNQSFDDLRPERRYLGFKIVSM